MYCLARRFSPSGSCEHGGTGFPHTPARGRVWEGQALAQGSGETGFPHAPTRGEGLGETGFPHTPTRWEGLGGPGPCAGVWGNRVSPRPHPREGLGGRSPPPNLPPLGGGAGLPPPSGGRAGEGGSHRARVASPRASCPRSRSHANTYSSRCSSGAGSRRGPATRAARLCHSPSSARA